MDRILYITKITMCLALAWLFSACTDDILNNGTGANGVDMSQMVEVDIPFSLGKGITSYIETRSTNQQGKDSQLSGIMVFVYENNGNTAENDKRISFQLFESPLTSLEGSTGGWIPDKDDPTRGHFKLYLPKGDMYIYLIGNAKSSFVNFFPDRGNNELLTRKDFLEKVTPKWSGNMLNVDGFLPLAGTVNNKTGACSVVVETNGKAVIQYKKENDNTLYSITETDSPNADNSFVLKRLMCKVSMKFKNGKGVKFTPRSFRFCHCNQYVPPAIDAWTGLDKLETIDTNSIPFSAQTPDSFTVYLPENIREYTGNKTDWVFADRDRVLKNQDGTNRLEHDINNPQPGHEQHYLFEHAPFKSTYVEITGWFEGETASANTKYILHLGDFSKNLKEFSLHRDHHYQYTVTVNGVKDIEVEVTGNETNPAVEGVVFEHGARLQLDAHYEQVEMKLEKNVMGNGVYIYAKTPFGSVNCKYLPQEKRLDPKHHNVPATIDEAKKLLQWIEFKKQGGKGRLATYAGTGNRMDVFGVLDDAFNNTDQNNSYYTCFVDEYYYSNNPTNNSTVTLKEFINAEDRTFSMASDIKYSADGKSAVVSASYMLQQHSIACFYDLDNKSVAKFGVELTDEIGGLPYGNRFTESSNVKTGRDNTLDEIGRNTGAVNWEKNGFLLDNSDRQYEVINDGNKNRLNNNMQEARLACLARNRDFDGNGRIEGDELRWYTPARDQMLGLWIGEPALPAKAALYPSTTANLTHQNYSNYPIYTSTNGGNRVIWAEEGCSFGAMGSANDKGHIRAVRNLGMTPSDNSHTVSAQEYYNYNEQTRTIEVYLTENALRAYSSRELAPHHERSEVNRPYKRFQVASKPYTEEVTARCEGHKGTWGTPILGPEEKKYTQLQTTDANTAKSSTTTIAQKYKEAGDSGIDHADWRLPNQREMALMVVAIGDYTQGNQDNVKEYVCRGKKFGRREHDWEAVKNFIFHCRTSFSNSNYAKHGYMHNTNDKLIQMLWTKNTGDGNIDLGQGPKGDGGYLCVRDVK